MFGDIFDSHDRGRTSGILSVEAGDNVKHPLTYRTVPMTESCLAQNVNDAKVRNSALEKRHVCVYTQTLSTTLVVSGLSTGLLRES